MNFLQAVYPALSQVRVLVFLIVTFKNLLSNVSLSMSNYLCLTMSNFLFLIPIHTRRVPYTRGAAMLSITEYRSAFQLAPINFLQCPNNLPEDTGIRTIDMA
jgi:hypothetical protein